MENWTMIHWASCLYLMLMVLIKLQSNLSSINGHSYMALLDVLIDVDHSAITTYREEHVQRQFKSPNYR